MDPDISSWPTRAQAAAVFEVSATTVRRMEKEGVLHPVKDDAGTNRFDPAELERIRRERQAVTTGPAASVTSSTAVLDGPLAAQIFCDLDDGRTPVEIVQQRELPPHIVVNAVAAYHRLRGLDAPSPERLEQLHVGVGDLWARTQGLEVRLAEIERWIYLTISGVHM